MTNENIEVGEYIRTFTGEIRTMKGINEDGYIIAENMLYKKNKFLPKNIKKHSKNINDLIEEGDFVNDEMVYSVWGVKRNKRVLYIGYTNIENVKIETIMTREHYNQICCFVEKWENLEKTKINLKKVEEK